MSTRLVIGKYKNFFVKSGIVLASALFLSSLGFYGYFQDIPLAWWVGAVLQNSLFVLLVLEFYGLICKGKKLATIYFSILGGMLATIFFLQTNYIPGCPEQTGSCLREGITGGWPFLVYFDSWAGYFPWPAQNYILPLFYNFAIVSVFIYGCVRLINLRQAGWLSTFREGFSFRSRPALVRSGFTLIELMVVISIISLLASVLLVNVVDARRKGRDAKRVADTRQLITALGLYYNQYGQYPGYTESYGENEPGCNAHDTDSVDYGRPGDPNTGLHNPDGIAFLRPLIDPDYNPATDDGFMTRTPKDPLSGPVIADPNGTVSCSEVCPIGTCPTFGYSYYRLPPQGGCVNHLYILQVRKMETNNRIGYEPPKLQCNPGFSFNYVNAIVAGEME